MSNFSCPSLPLLNVHPNTKVHGVAHTRAPLLCMAVLIWLLASLPLSLSRPPAQWQKSTAPHKEPAKLVNGEACLRLWSAFLGFSPMFPLLEEAEWLHLREVVKGDECGERVLRMDACVTGWYGMSCAVYANKLPQLLTFLRISLSKIGNSVRIYACFCTSKAIMLLFIFVTQLKIFLLKPERCLPLNWKSIAPKL